jgi:Zn-dependent protease
METKSIAIWLKEAERHVGGAAFLAILIGFSIYSWLVMTGRKAMVFKVPSFAPPEFCSSRIMRFVAKNTGEDRVMADGTVERVMEIGKTRYISHTLCEDPGMPNAEKFWTRLTNGERVSEYWVVNMVREARFGSVSTLARQGRFQPAVFFLILLGTVVTAVMLLFATKREVRTKAPQNRTHAKSAAATTKESVASRKRFTKGAGAKIDSFVSEYGNELMLSALAILSFSVAFGWDGTLLLAPIILVHEYGHVLAFRMFGHVGNRMMLVPFMGGVAVPAGGYRTEYEAAFTAIMGPAICIPLSVGLTLLTFAVGDHWTWWWFAWAAMLCASMNALNLFPALPLDGGHAFQAIARSMAPTQTSAAMFVLTFAGAVLLEYAGYSSFASIVGVWGGMEVARNWNLRSGLTPLSFKSALQVVAMHLGTLGIHLLCAWTIWTNFY